MPTTTRSATKNANVGVRPQTQPKKEAGKTAKQLREEAKQRREEAKELKEKEEKDNIQQVFEIEQEVAKTYATVAKTTPAGSSRTRTGKVKQVYGVRTLTAVNTPNPHQCGLPSGTSESLGSPQKTLKGKKPTRKIREAIQQLRDAEGHNHGSNMGRGTKRTHMDDPLVSYVVSSEMICTHSFAG